MADDRKRRPGSVWGDTERSSFGRKRTEPGITAAVPVEIDEESTPPPLDMREAVGQLWELRHMGEQIERHTREIRGYTAQVERHDAQLEQWASAVQRCIADLDEATRRQASMEGSLERFFKSEWPQLRTALDGFAASIRDLDRRIGKLETSIEHVGGKQLTQAEQLIDHGRRLSALELDKNNSIVASSERIRIFTFARVVIVALAGVAGWVANQLAR